MARKQITHVTPSGVQIPDDEYAAIKAEATKDTVRNVFAVIGIGAVLLLAKGYLDSRKAENETHID